jgi:hypothetical protein
MSAEAITALEPVVARLRKAGWKEREAIKAELLALASAAPDRDAARRYLEEARRGTSDLEVRWEIEEVIEALTPPPAPAEPEAEAEPEQPRASDFTLVYDDPRGLQLYKSKDGKRWAANQVDPRTGQPMSFELMPQEVEQLRGRLRGSPFWVLGSGEGQG